MTDTQRSARDALPAEGGTSIHWAVYDHITHDHSEWPTYDAIAYITRRCQMDLNHPTDFGVFMQAHAFTGWKEMGDGYGRNTSGDPPGSADAPTE